MSESWTYSTRKLTSWYGTTAIATTILTSSGDSVVIPAGRILTGIHAAESSSWYLEGLEYNGSTWEQIHHPCLYWVVGNDPSEIGGYGADTNDYVIVFAPIYCDGTNIRIRGQADTYNLKYWYFTEDT